MRLRRGWSQPAQVAMRRPLSRDRLVDRAQRRRQIGGYRRQLLKISPSQSSIDHCASAAVRTGSGFGAGRLADAPLDGTSFTVTVFTLTGVSGAFEPGAIAVAGSSAVGALNAIGALSAAASCGFAIGVGTGSVFGASATCLTGALVEASAMC